MTKRRCLILLMRTAVLAGCLALPSQVDAGWFDWLCGRSSYNPTYAVPAYTAAPTLAQPTCNHPVTSPQVCSQPVYSQATTAPLTYAQPINSQATYAQPAYAVAPQWTAQPAANRLWPFHRSSWARVPVTSYRYAAVNDPTTGAAALAPQPCQTYCWQPRPTIPQTAGNHSWFSWLHPWRRASYTPAYYGTTANYPCYGCATSPVATGGVNYPAAVPTTQVVPATQAFSGQVIPSAMTQPVLQTVPADSQPQLDPRTFPPTQPGVEYRGMTPSVAWPPAQAAQPATASVESARPVPPEVKPIPDAEAEREAAKMDGVPALLPLTDESDRSALQVAPNGRIVVPISWPANAPLRHSPAPTVLHETWDDSGWKSERAW